MTRIYFCLSDINWKKHQKENDGGYASIDDISMSVNARKSLAMKESSSESRPTVARSPPIKEQSGDTSRLRQDTRSKIFEMQNMGFENSGFLGPNSYSDEPEDAISGKHANDTETLSGNIGINPVYEDINIGLRDTVASDSDMDSEPECMLYESSEDLQRT